MGSIAAAFAAVAAALAPPGVVSADGSTRWVARQADTDTVVTALSARGGAVSRSTTLPGRFRVPVVARDGTVGGLSFDGGTLVLAEPPRRGNTRLAVVDTRRFTSRTLALPGEFSFDALSPDGRLLYLIEHASASDRSLYRVRAYDLARGRLLGGAVADKRTGQTAMRGVAVSRTESPDGRWAYTLYAGGPHPFVHALDTVRRQAVCLDVHGVGERRIWFARLAVSPDGSQLLLYSGGRTLAALALP
jgi:hypothetical protein